MKAKSILLNKIKGQTILLISIIVALLINAKRILVLLGYAPQENPNFTDPNTLDCFFRIIVFLVYSWLVLKFNIVWINRLRTKFHSSLIIIIRIIGSMIIAVSTYFSWIIVYNQFFIPPLSDAEQTTIIFGWFIVLITLLLISFILRLQIKSKNDAIEKETLKREKIKNELSAIKNQIDPHFLFNSLNTLNSVIRENPESATKFVDKLSFMYRYILQSSKKELVSLSDELDFLNSYSYIMKLRYGIRFQLEIKLDLDLHQTKIPVLSLQIVVENAIKHNEITKQFPLKVIIWNDKNHIFIQNRVKARIKQEKTTQTGLLNLSVRYKYLMNDNISIQKDKDFRVQLPIKNT